VGFAGEIPWGETSGQAERSTNSTQLAQAVHQSDQVVLYWQKILELQKAVPAPMGLSDLGNALFVLIVLAGAGEGADRIDIFLEMLG